MSAEDLFHSNFEVAYSAARGIARRMPRRMVRIDELRNAALIGLWHASKRFDAGCDIPFDAYAIHCCRGAVLDWLRTSTGSRRCANYQKTQPLDSVPPPIICDPAEDLIEQRDLVQLGLRGLSIRDRLIVRLRYFEHMTQAEIGRCMAVSESLVNQLLPQIRSRMRRTLAAHGEQ